MAGPQLSSSSRSAEVTAGWLCPALCTQGVAPPCDAGREAESCTAPQCTAGSVAKSFGGAGFGLGSFFFAVLRRSSGFEGTQKTGADAGDVVNCCVEQNFIGFRWFVETADFSDELERSGANLFVSDWGIEVEEEFDVPAHFAKLSEVMAEEKAASLANYFFLSLGL
jgi:hypothetical protein